MNDVEKLSAILKEKDSAAYKSLSAFLGKPPEWEDINKVVLEKWKRNMLSNLSPATSKRYCASMRAILNLYEDIIDIGRDVSKNLNVKVTKSVNTYLSLNEINTIGRYCVKNSIERDVLNQFILQCWTGCRVGDCGKLSTSNIQVMNNVKTISYTSEKTKITAVVPLKPIVENILRNRGDFCLYDNTTYNRTIQHIAFICNISEEVTLFRAGKVITIPKWKAITSHTARRSFATNLYLNGVDIVSISKMMGHSNTAQTERYICTPLNINTEIKNYFA